MIVFYDPADGQVMAVYSGNTTSTVWTDRGFLRANSDIAVTRDHKVVVVDGKVTSATPNSNPDQPSVPSFRDRIIERLRADPILRAHAIEMRDRLGLTNQQMLNLIEQKAGETV